MDELNFRDFTESIESELKKTLRKLPLKHRKLVQTYKFSFEHRPTIKGQDHVGEIDEKKHKIKIAAPWFHSREFTILHEVAHAVWKYILNPRLQQEWKQLLQKTKKQQIAHTKDRAALNQNQEEIFCMAYASYYAEHKPFAYHNDAWMKFIKQLPK